MAEYFLVYLVEFVKILPSSATSYLSHVVHHLFIANVIEERSELRSARANRVLKGLVNSTPRIPLRERVRVPCTINIAITAISLIPTLTSDECLAAGLEAAVTLGYALSLRPQEYLKTSRQVPLSHQANASLAFFWFSGVPISVTRPDLYPVGVVPEAFSLFLDFNKNNQEGQGGPRSIWLAPADSDFCCVTTLFGFFKAYPPEAQSPLLSGIGARVSTTNITDLFEITAARLNLPAGRLLPHSLRSGAIVQLVAAQAPVHLLLGQGDWHSLQGLRSYAHTSLEHARDKTAALHDVTLIPVAHSVHQYSVHS
jgi:hypothetical protein